MSATRQVQDDKATVTAGTALQVRNFARIHCRRDLYYLRPDVGWHVRFSPDTMPMQRHDDADCFPREVGASQGRVSVSTDVFCLGVVLLSGEAPSRDGADGPRAAARAHTRRAHK